MKSLDILNFGEELPNPAALSPQEVSSVAPWPTRLAFDLALGMDTQEEIREQHQLTEDEFLVIVSTPAFRRELADQVKEIRANGVTFKAKAKLQAEEYLTDIDNIITNLDVAASTRLDAIKSVVKWAGYEPKDGGKEQPAIPTFNIQFNL